MAENFSIINSYTSDYKTIKSILCTHKDITLPDGFWSKFFEINGCKTVLEQDIPECAEFLIPAFQEMTDYDWIGSLSSDYNKRENMENDLFVDRYGRGGRGAVGYTPETYETYLIRAIIATSCRKILKYFLDHKTFDRVRINTEFHLNCKDTGFRAYYKENSKHLW